MRSLIFNLTKNNYFVGIIFAVIFFLIALFTISDYGINADEAAHFARGQALFHFLRTGEKTYTNLKLERQSQWQYPEEDANYYLKEKDASHPTLNDIGAAAFNYFFYQNLGWLGDAESYHLFEILVSSLLVFLVYLMVSVHFGRFAGAIGVLSLALYPLFLGESHFNIKDPVQATFFSFTIYLFYLGINKTKGIYFVLSGIFFAGALGTKFNALFIPFILIPYIIVRFFPCIYKHKLNVFKKIPLKIYFYLVLGALTSLLIYLYFNPQLWVNPAGKFINEQISYYKDIGTGVNYEPGYKLYGFNLYPLFFIFFSTPIIILFFSILGIFIASIGIPKEKEKFSLLVILWFLVPIARVTVPGTSIYGGVRQIMEYVPAMAILSGIGAAYVVKRLNKFGGHIFKQFPFVQIAIIILFLPTVLKLISIHPNETVYLSELTGGLKGAYAKKIPSSGQDLGNVYRQGINWLNKHAEKNAKLSLVVNGTSAVPRAFIRRDIKFSNDFWSGKEQGGEYVMSTTEVGWDLTFPEKSQFLESLMPVYEVRVDGASILKIWKNDKEHTYKG